MIPFVDLKKQYEKMEFPKDWDKLVAKYKNMVPTYARYQLIAVQDIGNMQIITLYAIVYSVVISLVKYQTLQMKGISF